MRRMEPLGATCTALFVGAQLAAWTLLGITVYDSTAGQPHTSWAEPDRPLDQPDPPPEQDAT